GYRRCLGNGRQDRPQYHQGRFRDCHDRAIAAERRRRNGSIVERAGSSTRRRSIRCDAMIDARSFALALTIAAVMLPFSLLAEPIEPLLKVAPGFAVERIYVVPRDTQGSWISLAADGRGTLYASDQYGPLYQVKVAGEGSVSAAAVKLPIGGV